MFRMTTSFYEINPATVLRDKQRKERYRLRRDEIYIYSKSHTITETRRHFKLSEGRVRQIIAETRRRQK